MTLAPCEELATLSLSSAFGAEAPKTAPPQNPLIAFRELLYRKGWTSASGKWLIDLPEPPPLNGQESMEFDQVLQEEIDYSFEGEDYALAEEAWIQKIQAQFRTVKIELRGSRAAHVLNLRNRFASLLGNDRELQEAWERAQEHLPLQALPQDTDWLGEVEGLSTTNIKNRLIQVLSSYLNAPQEKVIQHGFQNLAESRRTPLIQGENSFVIATIGNRTKADILIGKLTRFHLFPRDGFYIGLKGSIEKKELFWQALYDRLFGIVRLDQGHRDNFHCFLSAIELKCRGLQVIEEEASLQEISAPFLHLEGPILIKAILKKINSKKMDPFFFLFHLFSSFQREDLWQPLISTLLQERNPDVQSITWKILKIVDRHRISYPQTSASMHRDLSLGPNELHASPSHEILDRFFALENGFIHLEQKGALAIQAAAMLLDHWEKGLLDEPDAIRLKELCGIRGETRLEALASLLGGPFSIAALPFFLTHFKPLPPLAKLQVLASLPSTLTCWDLLLQYITMRDLEAEASFFENKASTALFHRLVGRFRWTFSPVLYPLIRSHQLEINTQSAEDLTLMQPQSPEELDQILALITKSLHPQKQQLVEKMIRNVIPTNRIRTSLQSRDPLKGLRIWIEIEKKYRVPELREALLEVILEHPDHLVELTTQKKRRKEKLRQPFLVQWIHHNITPSRLLIPIAESLLSVKAGYCAGLELIDRLAAVANTDEKRLLIRSLSRFAKKQKIQTKWPEEAVQFLGSLMKRIKGWDLYLEEKKMLALACRPFPFLHHAEPILRWSLNLVDRPDCPCEDQEVLALFEMGTNAPIQHIEQFLRSSGFRTLLTEDQKFHCLVQALSVLRHSNKDCECGIKEFISLLTSVDFSLSLDAPADLLNSFNDLVSKGILISIAQYKKWRDLYQTLLYALLWFILNDNSQPPPKLHRLKDSYLALRARQTPEKVKASDETAAFFMRHVTQFILTTKIDSKDSALFIPFMIDHLQEVAQQGPLCPKYPVQGFFDLSFLFPEFFGQKLQACFNLITHLVQRGFFEGNSKQAALYMLIAKTPYAAVLQNYPVNPEEKGILKEVMIKLMEILDSKGFVQSESVDSLINLMNYLVEERLFEQAEEFLKAMNVLKKHLYFSLPFLDQSKGATALKMTSEIYLKSARQFNQMAPQTPIIEAFNDFRKKSKSIQSVGQLPAQIKTKYTIII